MTTGHGAGDAARLRPEWVLLALLTAGFFWGLGFPLMKMVSADFSAVALASLRGVLGGSTLMLWFLLMRQGILPRSRQETLDWLVLGALNGWIPNVLTAFATQSLPGGQAAMIQACGPLITALMASRMFSDERLTPWRLAGILIGFAGVGLLIGPRLAGSGGTPAAALAMLGVACCYASGNVYVRRLPVADPRRLALGQQVISGIAATLIALALVGPSGYAPLTQHAAPVLALGILCTAVPIVIFMYILRAAGPTKAALTGYIMPVWAVTLSALLLGEAIGLREAMAGIIILAGVAIVTRSRTREDKPG
ncbi:MAG: DMT family transporter [Beijerinckiaceae bacterium]|nr:DMT family transporter [Beijerinckiaceae bacterium]MCZ8299702.1 DMT family transporter [Beijerinckiaceae bacterium]